MRLRKNNITIVKEESFQWNILKPSRVLYA